MRPVHSDHLTPSRRLRGIRLGVLVAVGLESLARQRGRATLTMAVVCLAVTAVIATTGRTSAARHQILDRLEDPAARLVRITAIGSTTRFDAAAVARVGSIRSVAWVIGLGPAEVLGYNPATGDVRRGFAREPVGTRTYSGDLTRGATGILRRGRLPTAGEAVAGSAAAHVLGLADGIGWVVDDSSASLPVVGTVELPDFLAGLDKYVLVLGDPSPAALTEVDVLAATGADVEPLVNVLPALLGIDDPTAISVQRAELWVSLRRDLAADVGSLDRAILLASLLTSALLVSGLLYGAITERRREFGLRRTQGATRGDIASLVVIEACVVSFAGATIGVAAGTAAVFLQTGSIADPVTGGALASLVCLAALAGSIPPAITAAFREPLLVLRSS